ncbi:hypothetical protein JJQ09_18680 [Enterobacter hormaechei]|uniref:hypothetical protein n=1 Tax=Enterobacter hormaechei TaxID=158836 RepID=UPI0018ECA9ED|nr:hypothetical protein [Enterobacter hormaechei]MBJ6416606.1 hypothetical protein [Enterobacter hormaechei]MBK4279355.1 hypothetical protein [Enterobacter hormaechei]MBK4498113.1 hypothetical protein [Enterobacter hormaechei]MBK4522568.1 hypothetical protein [Enterobacter hormaechei]MBK4541247.1 hypothetical protein [Enterobacter hormaechei]
MSNKYEDLIKNARMNADCGEHMSPAEVTTLLNVVETTFAALAGEVYDLKHPGTHLPSKREAPALDAFLAEVRASAVDEACLKISNAIVNCYQDEMVGLDEAATICGDFASQLRKGGATEERQSFLSDEDCQAFVKAFTKGAAQ